MATHTIRPKFFVDEQGFHLHQHRKHGRALAGQPARLTTVPKGKRVNLIGCLGLQGFVHHRIVNPRGDQTNGVDAEEFRAFLLDLAPKLPRASVVVLDNVKIHHAEKLNQVWTMLNQTYAIEHAYLPPYSPFMNPIEYAFNKLKGEVQKDQFWNRGELVRTIERKIPCITPEDSQGFFQKSFSYYPQAALGLPFQGKALDPRFEQPFTITNNTTAIVPVTRS
jgi:transposase